MAERSRVDRRGGLDMSDLKQGVFISHISEEQEAAHLLKFYLRRALGEDLPVFVSSITTAIRK